MIDGSVLRVPDSDEKVGDVGAKVQHLRNIFLSDIFQCIRVLEREAEDNNVCVRIRQRAKSVIAILACTVENEFGGFWGGV